MIGNSLVAHFVWLTAAGLSPRPPVGLALYSRAAELDIAMDESNTDK